MVLLGPQRHRPTVGGVLDDLGVEGPVAVVSSGWEERETELDELARHLEPDRRPLVPLDLFTRAERILESDGDFAAAWRRRRLVWNRLARVHRVRVNAAIEVVQALAAEPASPMREAEIEDAIAHVARLDDRHHARIAALLDEFDEDERPAERPAVRRELDAVAALLEGTGGLLVAGGDVGVLHRTLRLFGLPAARATATGAPVPVVAWSAGAMALSSRIVLFHDRPPQGFTHAEVHGPGMGVVPGLVLLPHARHRLALDDAQRVSILAGRLAGRLAPLAGVTLDEGARIDLAGTRVVRTEAVGRLHADGAVRPLAPGSITPPSAEAAA